MYSELNHSKQLSKRFKRSFKFRSLLDAQNNSWINIMNGVKKSKYIDENESIFSKVLSFDSEEEFEKVYQNLDETDVLSAKRLEKQYRLTKEAKTKSRLKKSKLLNKKLYLVPTVICKGINPIKHVRYFDYYFPLDSRIFDEFTLRKNQNEHAFFDISDHKRVTSVIYDNDEKEFTSNFHFKIAHKQISDFYQKIKDYYIDWLKSLGNKKALKFVEALENIEKSRTIDTEKQKILDTEQHGTDKIFISHIDKQIKDYQRGQPVVIRLTKIVIDNNCEEKDQIQETLNQPFFKLIGYKEEDKDQILKNLLDNFIQKGVTTQDPYDILDTMLTRKKKSNSDASSNHDGFHVIKRKNGNGQIEFKTKAFKEKWYQEGAMYTKTYTLLTDVRVIDDY